MSDPIDDDLPQVTEGDGQQAYDDIAGSDNHEGAEETRPCHYDVVPQHLDGDVIWQCKDNVSFLVSSVVLRLTSKYSVTMLGPKFMEGQIPRSTTNPQRIESGAEDLSALHRMFCLLHHQRDPETAQYLAQVRPQDQEKLSNRDKLSIEAAARRLRDLAVVIDEYDCFEPLDRVINSLLNDFATPSIRDRMTFTATVHMTSAAYILNNSGYFRLFTKRLVTDYTERFEDADFDARLPDVISELDGQSRQSWYRLRIVVNELAKCQCTASPFPCYQPEEGGKDRLLVEKLKDCLFAPGIAWPTDRGDGITLRHILIGLYNLERMHRYAWYDEHKSRIHDTVGPDDFKRHCQEIDKTDTVGLCLACTRKFDGLTAHCKCLNNDARLWVRGDSFRPGTVLFSVMDSQRAQMAAQESQSRLAGWWRSLLTMLW